MSLNISDYCINDVNWRPQVGQILTAKMYDQPWHVNRSICFVKVSEYKKGAKTFKVELLDVYFKRGKHMEPRVFDEGEEEVERVFLRPAIGEMKEGEKRHPQIYPREQVCRWMKNNERWIIIVKSEGDNMDRIAIAKYDETQCYF